MKIQSVQMHNIQSWDDNSPTLNLAEDKMNVIIAPSETGKSVLIKVLKEMCFAGAWGYTHEGLIRRGASKGLAYFFLEDGSIVVFELLPKTQNYFLVYLTYDEEGKIVVNDKEEPIYGVKKFIFSDMNVEIPEEIAEAMGLIIDRKAKTVINVLDKDMLIPFVTAPPALNARILAAVTEDPNLERILETLEKWKELESNYITSIVKTMHSINQKLDRSSYIDEQEISRKIMHQEECIELLPVLGDLADDYEKVREDFWNNQKEVPEINIDTELKLLKAAENILSECETFERIANTQIELVDEPPADGVASIALLKAMEQIVTECDSLPEEPPRVEKLSYELPECIKLLNLIKDSAIVTEDIPDAPENIKELNLDKELQVLKVFEELGSAESSGYQAVMEALQATRKCKSIHKELVAIKEELGVCPTCKQPFKEKSK